MIHRLNFHFQKKKVKEERKNPFISFVNDPDFDNSSFYLDVTENNNKKKSHKVYKGTGLILDKFAERSNKSELYS